MQRYCMGSLISESQSTLELIKVKLVVDKIVRKFLWKQYWVSVERRNEWNTPEEYTMKFTSEMEEKEMQYQTEARI